MSTTTTQDLATVQAMPVVDNDTAIVVYGVGKTSVATNPAFIQRRDDLLEQAREITSISDDFGEAEAVEVVRGLKAIGTEVEKSRKAIKRPFIDLNALIEAMANAVRESADQALVRLQSMLDARARAKLLAAQAAERARQEAIAKAERERLAALKAQEDARLAKEAAERAEIAAREEADLAAKGLAPVPVADEDKPFDPVVPPPQEPRAINAAVQAAIQAEIELKAQKPVEPEKATGTTIREEWTYTVTDAAALYAARPDLVGLVPRSSEIRKLVLGGLRELAGVEITKVVNYKVGR